MYQVIARKWRPQTFEEVTGQEAITRTLRNAIEHERLHHAYLFSGARGVGKTTTARLLAKALNCHKTSKPNPTPCAWTDPDACVSCKEIAESRSIDVQEIDAASNTGVDNVRDQIINTVAIRPARDRYRVFIIDEVHMLSTQAFNALLKTLEEPPPNVVFIMATTEAHKIPDTILSRSQQFEFRIIAVPKIYERLKRIADAEKIDIDDAALRDIARAGEGSMRDAQSAFDQVISFSQGRITTTDVEIALGLASTEMLVRVVRAIADEKPTEVLRVVDDLSLRGHDLRNFCRDLLAQMRDLLVMKIGANEDNEAHAELTAQMRELSREFSESDFVRFFHSLTQTERDLRESAHPRYQLELGLIKLIEMRRLAAIGDIVSRLGQLEESLRNNTPATRTPPASSSSSTPSSTPSTSNAPPASGNAAPASSFSSATTSPTANAVAASTPLKLVAPVSSPLLIEDARTGGDTFAVARKFAPLDEVKLDEVKTDGETQTSIVASAQIIASPENDFVAPASEIEHIKNLLEERRRAFVVVALEQAESVRLETAEIVVEYLPKQKHLRENLMKPDVVKLLHEVCREVTGRDLNLCIRVKDEGESAPRELTAAERLTRQEQDELRAIAEASPIVQKLMSTFRAQIVDVRRVDKNAAPPSSVK